MIFKNSTFVSIIEKIPGVNFVHVARFREFSVIMTPKVGTRTIRDALIYDYGIKGDIEQKRKKAKGYIYVYSKSSFHRYLRKKEHDCYLITRDSYDRLKSCWKQKVLKPERRYPYFIFYYPFISSGMTFRKFVDIVSLIPVTFCEKHFIPQSYYISKTESLECVNLSSLDQFFNCKIGKTIVRANETKASFEQPSDRKYFHNKLGTRYYADNKIHAQSQEWT